MLKDRLTLVLFALLAGALLSGALLLSYGAPAAAAAPRPVLTASAEPPTPTLPGVNTVVPTALPSPQPTLPPELTTPTTATPPAVTATPPPEDTPRPDRDADPAVSKETSSGTVTLGDEVSFSITVTNEGNDLAQGVIVEDALPGYLELVSASIDKGQVVTSGNTVGFWIGDVEPGEVIRGEITARVVAIPDNGVIINEAVLRSSNGGDRPVNNRAEAQLRVVAPTPTPTSEPLLLAQPQPSPTPGLPTPTPPPPTGLPVTASSMPLPYGLLFLAGVAYMAVGLYLWLRPRRRW